MCWFIGPTQHTVGEKVVAKSMAGLLLNRELRIAVKMLYHLRCQEGRQDHGFGNK